MSEMNDKGALRDYMLALGDCLWVYQKQCEAGSKKLRHQMADMLIDIAEVVRASRRMANFDLERGLELHGEIFSELQANVHRRARELEKKP